MAQDISSRLTRQAAARFGRVVGTAFLLFALIGYWRHGRIAPRILGLAGALLVTLSFVAPTLLAPIERVWMAMARAISRITAPIVMGALFFLVITPLGLLRRAVGKRGLPTYRSGESTWHRREASDRRSNLNRQF